VSHTVDAILRGRVRVVQPKEGPRFAVDPVLLADFVVRGCGVRAKTACDLGAGTGVLGLVLAALDPRVRVTGIEMQPQLAALAEKSIALSGQGDRVRIEKADLRQVKGRYDLVAANPPYHKSGRVSPKASRAVAHHEVECTIEEVVAAARRLLGARGQFVCIWPAERLFDLTSALAAEKFRLRFVRFVHPRIDRPAARVLALAQLGVRSTARVLPPLVLHEGTGFTAEAAAILDGRC
jgi:tRNA1(Val) A37 N6-methylase TrmN6